VPVPLSNSRIQQWLSSLPRVFGSLRLRLLFLALLAAVSIVPRVVHPTADPIMGPMTEDLYVFYTDEGWLAHNARNRVLLGKWSTCTHNPMVVMPGMTLMQTLSFSVMGVGVVQARMLPIGMAVGCWALLGMLVARASRRTDWLPLLALFFLGMKK
jgi:hypothetical protein